METAKEVLDTIEIEELKSRIKDLEEKLEESEKYRSKWFCELAAEQQKTKDLKAAFVHFIREYGDEN